MYLHRRYDNILTKWQHYTSFTWRYWCKYPCLMIPPPLSIWHKLELFLFWSTRV